MATAGEAARMPPQPEPLRFTSASQVVVTGWTATATGLPVNHSADHWKTRRARPAIWLCVPLFLLTSACDSEIVEEAERAEDEGAVVNNEAMVAMYPRTFRPGSPAYLERDFEAGADFICDEINLNHRRAISPEEPPSAPQSP